MGAKKIIAKENGYYHVISRITGGQFLINDQEKDVLMQLMVDTSVFSGIEVLTFALMDNHFHLLVKVPKAYDVDDQELVEKMRMLYGDTKTDRVLGDWKIWEKKGLQFKVDDAKAALRRRMFSLPQFCKTLKEAYSMSYNRRHDHVGTIWGSRLLSILLSPDYKTLMTVGAYIDLNPVRAEIVEEASAYRWSGYGSAIRGNKRSRRGLCALVGTASTHCDVSFEVAVDAYTSAINGFIKTPVTGSTPLDVGEFKLEGKGNVQKPTEAQVFVREKVEAKIREGAKLSLFELLRCKVRYFSHGLAIGPESFIRAFVANLTPSKDTSRRCDCCDDVELYNARWLRGDDKVTVPKGKVPEERTRDVGSRFG